MRTVVSWIILATAFWGGVKGATPSGNGAVILTTTAVPGVGVYTLNRVEVTRTYSASNFSLPLGSAGIISPGTTTFTPHEFFTSGVQMGWDYSFGSNNQCVNSFIVTYQPVPQAGASYNGVIYPCEYCDFTEWTGELAFTVTGPWTASCFGVARDHTVTISGFAGSNKVTTCGPAGFGGCNPNGQSSANLNAQAPFDIPPADITGEIKLPIYSTMNFGSDEGVASIEIDLIYDPYIQGSSATGGTCPPAVYSVTPPTSYPGANGGTFSINVTAPSGCAWWPIIQNNLGGGLTGTSELGGLSVNTFSNETPTNTNGGSGTVTFTETANPYPSNYRSWVIDIAGTLLAVTQPPGTPSAGGVYALKQINVTRTYGAGIGGVGTNPIGALSQTITPGTLALAYPAGWDFPWPSGSGPNRDRFVSTINFETVPASVTPGTKAQVYVDMHGDWMASGYGVPRFHTISTDGIAGQFPDQSALIHCPNQSPNTSPSFAGFAAPNGNAELMCNTNYPNSTGPGTVPSPDSNGEITLTQTATTDFEDAGTVTVEADFVYALGGGVGLGFFAMTPCRAVDTRGGGKSGSFGPPELGGYASRDFPLTTSSCSLPSAAQAYSLNFTVVPSGPLGFLSAWPAGQSYPGVSTLNSPDGTVLANAAIVPSGSNGAVTVLASDPTNLIVDINGYFAPPNGQELVFYPITPCRLVDTRGLGKSGNFGPPSLGGYSSRDFPLLSGGCNIPNSAKAYSLNMTALPHGELDFLSTWPTGQSYPGVSTLNSPDGSVIANAAIVPAGSNGEVTVLAGNPTDLIIDANGYFAPPGSAGALHFYPVTPCRVVDTRSGGKSGLFGPPELGGYASRDFPLLMGGCNIPQAAQAYSLNLTAVPQGHLDFLSVWPTGQGYPGVSTLNSPDGTVMANAAIVPAGSNGAITVLAGNPTDLIIDINGYFAP